MLENKILKRIETLRRRLNKFERENCLVDAEIVTLSQELDLLLNQYYRSNVQQLSFW